MNKSALRESQFIIRAVELSWERNALSKPRGAATRKGMESIAQRVARIRKERGITQEELARLLNVSQPIVSDYERGELRLHGELIIQLAKILGVTTDELLGLNGPKDIGTRRSLRLLRRAKKIETLPPSQQKTLLKTIDTFLKGAER